MTKEERIIKKAISLLRVSANTKYDVHGEYSKGYRDAMKTVLLWLEHEDALDEFIKVTNKVIEEENERIMKESDY